MSEAREWNYTAWNVDQQTHATKAEIEGLGWIAPTYEDEIVKQGVLPTDLDTAFYGIKAAGGEGTMNFTLVTDNSETIEIEISI